MKFGIKDTVILSITEIFKKYKEVEKAFIFGSRARGDYRENSDIDIALFGEDLNNAINTKIYYEIEELLLPYMVDLLNFNSLKQNEKIKEEILKEGVEIYVR